MSFAPTPYDDGLYDRIQRDITGRLAITRPEAALLAKYASRARLYVEIGCLWGGTSILAALTGARQVITIDFMRGGFWDTGDPARGHLRPTPGHILDNFARFGVAHLISIYKGESDPWPLPGIYPDVVLIDGDHSYEGVMRDWANVRGYATRWVLFHDNMPDHPGVMRAIEEIRQDPDWRFVEQAMSMTVFVERTWDDEDNGDSDWAQSVAGVYPAIDPIFANL